VISLAVIKIKVLNVIGRLDELDKVTAALGATRAFHPDNALSFYSDVTGFSALNEANPYGRAITSLTDTLRSVGRNDALANITYPEKAELPVKDWNDYIDRFNSSVADLLAQKQQCEKEISDITKEIATISHFTGLDLDFDEIKACKFITFRFGSLPEESYERLSEYDDNPYVVFFSSKEEPPLRWGMYCAPVDQIDDVDRIFSSLYFEKVSLSDYSGTIDDVIGGLTDRIRHTQEKICELKASLDDFLEKEKKTFLGVYTWLTEKYTYYNIRHFAARYGESFILTGWIAADKEHLVRPVLDQFQTVRYAFDDAADPEVMLHSPPTQLINKRIWQPFEYFVNEYGLPAYDEIDPTAFIALTFTVFFGLMFADLGQGLCISLLGWLLWKKKKSLLGRAMVPCGIASAIVGTAFGSVFGFEDALDPFYQTIFGLPSKPISVMDETTTVVYFAIGLGMFMVMVAILTNTVACLKRRRYTDGVFGPNGIAGFVFYASVVFGFGGKLLNAWNIVSPLFVVVCIVLPLVLMMFREVLGGIMEHRADWKPDSWVEMIMQNFFEVFEFVLSYLTNTISFCRVGAYILVHAGMMMVVFKLAENAGVAAPVVIIFGNVFVIALEGLLSGVQALRLEFYEMFSRFYDGSGRPYTPVVVGQES
jgi:V/A-type H+-transporting ATPase subunit I